MSRSVTSLIEECEALKSKVVATVDAVLEREG